MSLNIKPGSSVITSKTGSEIPLSWGNATLNVHGEDVPKGKTLAFFRGQKNEVIVRASADIATELRLEIVDANGLVVDVQPIKKWQQANAGAFKWEVTPESMKSGKGRMIFISRELNKVWIHSWTAISKNLRDEIRFERDGIDHDPSDLLLLDQGETHEFTCYPQNDSPLEDSEITLRYINVPDESDVKCPEEGQSQTLAATGATSRFICGLNNAVFSFRVESDTHGGPSQAFSARLVEAET